MEENPRDQEHKDASGREAPRLRKTGCAATSYFESPLSSIISKSSMLNKNRGSNDSNPPSGRTSSGPNSPTDPPDKLYGKIDPFRSRTAKSDFKKLDVADVRTTAFDSYRKSSNPGRSDVSPPVLRSKMLSMTLPSSHRISEGSSRQLLPSSVGKPTSKSQTDASEARFSEQFPTQSKSSCIEKPMLESNPHKSDTTKSSTPLQVSTRGEKTGAQPLFDNSPTESISLGSDSKYANEQETLSRSPLSDSGFDEFKALHSRMVKPESRHGFRMSRQLSTSLTALNAEPSSRESSRKSDPSKRHSARLSYDTQLGATSGGSSPSRSPKMSRGVFRLGSSSIDDLDVTKCTNDKARQNVFLQKYLTNAQKEGRKGNDLKFAKVPHKKDSTSKAGNENSSIRKSELESSSSLFRNPQLENDDSYNGIKVSPFTSVVRTKPLTSKSSSQDSNDGGASRKKVQFNSSPTESIRSSDSEKGTSPPIVHEKWNYKTIEMISPSEVKNKSAVLRNNDQESEDKNNIVIDLPLKKDDYESRVSKDRITISQEKALDCKYNANKSENVREQKKVGSTNDRNLDRFGKEKWESSESTHPPLQQAAGLFGAPVNMEAVEIKPATVDRGSMKSANVISELIAKLEPDKATKNQMDIDSGSLDVEGQRTSAEENDFANYPLIFGHQPKVKFRTPGEDEALSEKNDEPKWEIVNLSDSKTDQNDMVDFEGIFKKNRRLGSSMLGLQRGQSSFSDLSRIDTFSAEQRSNVSFSAERKQEKKLSYSRNTFSNEENSSSMKENKSPGGVRDLSPFRGSKCSSSFDTSEFHDSFENGGHWKSSITEEEPGNEFKDFSREGFTDKLNKENRVFSEMSSAFRTEKQSVIRTTVTRKLRIGRTIRRTSRYTR